MGIYEDRRALHSIPELDRNLPKTLQYLQTALKDLNCRVFSPMEGALAAFFDFGGEKTLVFRADMDALPMQEKTGLPFASRHPGCMHACGHDGHMAILLELARRLNGKEKLAYNVLLLFQPAEETTGGAKDLCETGILQQYGVEAVFGLHLWPGLAAGTIASRKDEMMARSAEVTVDIYGRASHIAKAHLGLDALAAGMEFYGRAMALADSLPKETFRLLKFGKFQSGTVRNALSAYTHMEGSLRAFRDEDFTFLRDGLLDIGRKLEGETGCTVQIHLSEGYPAVMNPPALYDRVRNAVAFSELEEPSMTAEDFSWYQRYVPGLFFFLGTGEGPALHADTFDFDEAALLAGADFFEKIAENYP